MDATAHGKRVKIIKIECGLRKLQSIKNGAGVGMCRARGKTDSTSRVVAESLCFLSVVHAYRPTRGMRVEHSATRPRDLRSFEIRFECDVPIRKFRIGRTCSVPSYHKQHSLTVQQKHQPSRRL